MARFHFLIIACLALARSVQAQPVLLGCTVSISGQPQTTAKIVDVDPATGLYSNPRETGIYALGGIAIQPSTGQMFGLTTNASSPANSLVEINPQTGAAVIVGNTGLPFIVEGDLAFNPLNGMLYGVGDVGSDFLHRNFFSINPQTGTASIISSLPNNQTDYSALAFDGLGNLYCIDDGATSTSTAHLLRIDPATGAVLSNQLTNQHLGSAVGMAIDLNSGLAYVADGGGGATNALYSGNLS